MFLSLAVYCCSADLEEGITAKFISTKQHMSQHRNRWPRRVAPSLEQFKTQDPVSQAGKPLTRDGSAGPNSNAAPPTQPNVDARPGFVTPNAQILIILAHMVSLTLNNYAVEMSGRFPDPSNKVCCGDWQ